MNKTDPRAKRIRLLPPRVPKRRPARNLTAEQRDILSTWKGRERLTVNQLAARLGTSREVMYSRVKTLVNRGLLRSTEGRTAGGLRTMKYAITKVGKELLAYALRYDHRDQDSLEEEESSC